MSSILACSPLSARLRPRTGVVVAFPRRGGAPPHELASHHVLAARLAHALGRDFIPEYLPDMSTGDQHIYYIPAHTLVSQGGGPTDAPCPPGVRTREDLFGGVVPYPFVGTKAITHSLIHDRAHAPLGWSHAFGRQVREVVLPGITVFTLSDAMRAARLLLDEGPLRIKPVRGIGGRGQRRVESLSGFEEALHEMDAGEMHGWGLVLETDLDEVETYSVGHVCVGGMEAAYVGTQSLTPDNTGLPVYGGSELRIVRGGFPDLLALDLAPAERAAIRLACVFDAAALACYPAAFASRRNYDVASGVDGQGRHRMGVLEQSWRAGGASLAEICALQGFRSDPALRVVRAYTRERYGSGHAVPASAERVYAGEDSEVGLITKYGGIASYGDG